jgi:LPXTG-site transpeptidase (sortase) family protein
MRARFVRSSPALLLVVASILLSVHALFPSVVQASRENHNPLWQRTATPSPTTAPGAATPGPTTTPGAATPSPTTTPGAATPGPTTAPAAVTPGPTTAPPLLSITGTNTTTCAGISTGQAVTLTLTLANNSSQNTPADTTLVVNLPQGIASLAVSSSFGTSYTATMEGFMLPVVLAAGHSGQVTIAFTVGAMQTGSLDVTASVSEVGGSGEVLSNVYFTRIPLAPCASPTPGPTLTPAGGSGVAGTPTASASGVAGTPTASGSGVAGTPTASGSGMAGTPTPSGSGMAGTPTASASSGSMTPTPTPIPPTNTPQTPAMVIPPSATPVVPPSMTPVVPPSATPVVITKTVIRYQTVTRYRTLYRTVVRYKTVVRHRTIISVVHAVRVIRHPKTGRFADLAGYPRGGSVVRSALPKPDAHLSVPHLGIWSAPVWTRGYVDDGYGGITYDIVPAYGVTRFAYSVPFGTPGTTMVYGHDDMYGSIFRYLALLRRGDVVQVATARHRFTYVVRAVSTVSPTDVGMLTVPRARPTLALITCTPYWVDSQRVVVIAQMKR